MIDHQALWSAESASWSTHKVTGYISNYSDEDSQKILARHCLFPILLCSSRLQLLVHTR